MTRLYVDNLYLAADLLKATFDTNFTSRRSLAAKSLWHAYGYIYTQARQAHWELTSAGFNQ